MPRGVSHVLRLLFSVKHGRQLFWHDDVSVTKLVEKIRPNDIVLTLVNTNPTQARTVTVQMGAYAEHHCESVAAGGRTVAVDAPSFKVKLKPGAGETLTVSMKRYAHVPTLAFPWDQENK